MSLTTRQARFVEEYLIDLNATQAAIRAGYSKATANKVGPKLLVNVGIKAAIDAETLARSQRTQITVDKVLTDIEAIKQDAMRENVFGTMNNQAAALKACELQGRHLKMFQDKVEHSGGVTVIQATWQDERI